ncbi:MAG: DMT family transporter [archaeon]|jgi:drug/metabolite transporter (DMT)-like permease
MNEKTKGFLLVALSGALSGTIIFGGQIFSNLGLSLFELSTLPFIFSLFFLFPFIIKKKFFPKKELFPLVFIYGFAAAGAIFSQFGGLIFGVSVAVVVLLLYAQPLWTVLISKFFLKEKINSWQYIACTLVLIGVFFTVDPSNLFASKSWLGVLVALIGGIFLSIWIILGSRLSKKGVDPFLLKFYETSLSLVLIFLSYPGWLLLSSDPKVITFSLDFPLWIFGGLILYNLFSLTFNHLIYYAGSKRISTVDSGILMLFEPPVAILLAVVFLAQPLTFSVIIGGSLILLGNVIVIVKG